MEAAAEDAKPAAEPTAEAATVDEVDDDDAAAVITDAGASEPIMNAKAKKKAMLARADDRGAGGDMLSAYAEKKAEPEAPAPAPAAVVSAPPASPAKAAPPGRDLVSHPVVETISDDWESASDANLPVPAPAAVLPAPDAVPEGGGIKYTRDFLMTMMHTFTDVPLSLEVGEFSYQPGAPRPNDFRGGPPGPPSQMRGQGAPPPGMGGQMGSGFRGGPPGGGRGGGGPPDKWQHAPMPGGQQGGPQFGAPGMNAGGRGVGGGGGRGGPPVGADKWARGLAIPGSAPAGARGTLLHKTDQRYEIGKTRTDDPIEETKQKAFMSQLNKLTPDNFEKISGKILEVGIEQAKTLRSLIDQIFDKALVETTFTELYAELCAKMNANLPEFEDPDSEEAKKITFRRVLLNKCQEEFEAGDEAIKAVDAREKRDAERKAAGEVEAEEEEDDDADASKDGEEKAAPKAEEPEKEEGELTPEAVVAVPTETPAQAKRALKIAEAKAAAADLKARRRMLGNIQFIGQLYMKKMLTEKIMHECIVKLLGEMENPRQEDVECLIKMIRTIGQELESSKAAGAKQRMDVYFGRIQALSKSPKLESRVRFGLTEIRELRYNRWVERRKTEGPKTIAAVHADAQKELQMQRQQGGPGRGGAGGRGDRGGGGMGRRELDQYGGPPRGQIGTRTDAPLMRNADRLDVPPRAMSRTPSQEFLGPNGNGFRPGGRPGAGPPGSQRPAPPAPAAEAKRTPLNLSPKTGSAAAAAAAAAAAPPAVAAAAKPALSEEETRKKATSIIREWLGPNRNLKEVSDLFQELLDANADVAVAVEQWFSDAIEARGTDWSAVGELLVQLAAEKKLLNAAEAAAGLRSVLNSLADISIDAPKAPEHVGALMGALVAAGVLELKPMLQHILTAAPADAAPEEPPAVVDSGDALKVLGALLNQITAKKGEAASLSAWESTSLTLEAFLPERDQQNKEQLKREVEKAGLEFLLPGAPVDQGIAELLRKGESTAAVDAWLAANVSSAALTDTPFVRAFLLGVLRGTIPDPAAVNVSAPVAALTAEPVVELMTQRLSLSTRKAHVKIAAIAAVQHFFHEAGCPKGLMLRLLQDLYNSDVVAMEDLIKWKDDVDDKTPDKIKAITDVSMWLQQLDAEEEEE